MFDMLIIMRRSSHTTDPAMAVTDLMIEFDRVLADVPPAVGLQLISFGRRRLDANETRILADRYDKGADDRDVENMAKGTSGKTSKAAAKKTARRAKAANANPGLADKLADGTLSTEQVDIVAAAAEDTDGLAACDEELIDQVSEASPEQGKKKVRDWVNKRRSADDVQKRYDRQKRSRGVYRHTLNNGNSALTFHGTDEEIDEMEAAVNAQSDVEYQADGGRDVSPGKHRRTRDQRNFDAAHKLLAGKQVQCSGSSKARRRAVIFVTATVDQLTGEDNSTITTVDGKPLPNSFVDELAGDAAFIGQVFSADGELLWQGRQQRLATPAQINGLISRDSGCVECGAHYSHCVAHHLLPWEAAVHCVHSPSFSASPPNIARGGPTNINNLVLLCTDCHVRLHRAKRTMFYDIATRTWKTRPATSDEIPPDGRPSGKRPNPEKPRAWERQHQPTLRSRN